MERVRVQIWTRRVAIGSLVGLALVALPSTPSNGSLTADAAVDTTFTIAVVPDTQDEVLSASDTRLANRYRWLVDNAAGLDLRFVIHTGDVVNWGAAEQAQFQRADAATTILDASGIPFIYAIGNHDTAAVGVGGSAAPGSTHDNLRNTSAFNTTFPVSRFPAVQGAYETGKVDNVFQTFSAGGADWLVLTLEMWPRAEVLTWAEQVITARPQHNVIIVTHAFINGAGALPTKGNYGDTNAKVMWDTFVSKFRNIRLVLSGHYGPSSGGNGMYVQRAAGKLGNPVVEVMTANASEYQNIVRLITIDTATGTVSGTVRANQTTNPDFPIGQLTMTGASFTETGMSWVEPAAGSRTEHIADPGFEKGLAGWQPFSYGTLTRVTSPVRSGTYALSVTRTSTASQKVGITLNDAMTSTVKGSTYEASCYVRATSPGITLGMRLIEYSRDYKTNTKFTSDITVPSVSTTAWTKVTVRATAVKSGERMIPQLFSSNQYKSAGAVLYDDCSLATVTN